MDALGQIAPVFAVRGNNDKEWAESLPETLAFTLYGIHFFMVHNKKQIPKDVGNADIIVYGHSHKYEEKYADGRLFLNPGSCGPRRFTQPVTLAVLEVETEASFHVKKIEIPHKLPGLPGGEEEKTGKLPEDIRQVIEAVMKDTDKGKTVQAIAKKYGIRETLAEQICRLYLTHPGVDADGIMTKMGL